MFELMEIEDKPNIKVRAFGVGTVGCRLLSNAKFEIDESIELVYIHAESDFLESLDSQENFKIIYHTILLITINYLLLIPLLQVGLETN